MTFFDRIKKDRHFRITTFLFASFVVNVAYAEFLFIVSLLYSSKWFSAMSVYYALLSTARIFIFTKIDPKTPLRKKLSTIRWCGYFLLLINMAVSTIMFILLYRVPPVEHHEITVIALATYTFSTLTIAIVNGIRFAKQKAYVYFCAKIISLTAASVSLTTLTNTMLATFGAENALLRSIILPCLCGSVAIFIIGCAITMIYKATLAMRKLNHETK